MGVPHDSRERSIFQSRVRDKHDTKRKESKYKQRGSSEEVEVLDNRTHCHDHGTLLHYFHPFSHYLFHTFHLLTPLSPHINDPFHLLVVIIEQLLLCFLSTQFT